MQLNIYVPNHLGEVLDDLERFLARTGRSKNEVVLQAINEYLQRQADQSSVPAVLPAFDLGVGPLPGREVLYDEWLRERQGNR